MDRPVGRCNGPFQDLLAYLHCRHGIAIRTLADLYHVPEDYIEDAIKFFKTKPIWGRTNE